MAPSPQVNVRVDLPRVRQNVADIKAMTGRPVLAVVKADGYGLGAQRVAGAIADIVEGFCVYGLDEAIAAGLGAHGKRVLALGPAAPGRCDEYVAHKVQPGVCDAQQAEALRKAGPILCVDSGMQRFACPPEQIDATLSAGGCREAYTHAITMQHVRRLVEVVGHRGLRLHAAASALLGNEEARLSAVRPGLAMYRRAVSVNTTLMEARDGRGPAGYSGFVVGRHGVIPVGYSHGLRVGPCMVNRRMSRIVEVGMQTSFVELDARDKAGDPVLLLGEALSEEIVAEQWKTSPHEVLVRMTGAGVRQYMSAG